MVAFSTITLFCFPVFDWFQGLTFWPVLLGLAYLFRVV